MLLDSGYEIFRQAVSHFASNVRPQVHGRTARGSWGEDPANPAAHHGRQVDRASLELRGAIRVEGEMGTRRRPKPQSGNGA